MIQLYNGDCLELMKKIPDKSVDMILCDLPYGTTSCKWDIIIPFEPLWEQYNRIIKDNGAIVLFASQPFSSVLVNSNINNFRYEWIWEKDKPSNFALANKQPMKYHENIMVFYKKQPIYNKQITYGHKPMNGQAKYGRTYNGSVPSLDVKERYEGGKTTRNPSSIQKFNTPKHNSSDKSGLHPTQKPVALLEYLIKTYTNEGDLVLDNCMGSGSTGVACINTNRNFIGIELDKGYFDIAEKRINEAQNI
jgi:site-specific DNA-methyltransferase (adenine-specific)